MSRLALSRIPSDNSILRDSYLEQLRSYIEEEIRSHEPTLRDVANITVARRSDYYEIMIFVLSKDAVPAAEAFVQLLDQQLACEGIHALSYVRIWTGPDLGGSLNL